MFNGYKKSWCIDWLNLSSLSILQKFVVNFSFCKESWPRQLAPKTIYCLAMWNSLIPADWFKVRSGQSWTLFYASLLSWKRYKLYCNPYRAPDIVGCHTSIYIKPSLHVMYFLLFYISKGLSFRCQFKLKDSPTFCT